MPSKAIPQADKALLEAQAQAGPAGVAAYEAAKAELQSESNRTLQQAAAAARARGGPAMGMDAAMSQAGDITSRRLNSLSQAQASRQAAYDSREQRMENYNQAVLGARSLIGDQAKAAAQPTRLRSELELAQMRQGSQGAVARIIAQSDLDTVRAEAAFEAAEQAARLEEERYRREAELEQDRWEREMQQRERLAALDRAAREAAASRSSQGSLPTLNASELTAALQAGSSQQLENVLSRVSATLDDPQRLGEFNSIANQITMGFNAETMAPGIVYDKYFPEPQRDDFDTYKEYVEAKNVWRSGRNEWSSLGVQNDDRMRQYAIENMSAEDRAAINELQDAPQRASALMERILERDIGRYTRDWGNEIQTVSSSGAQSQRNATSRLSELGYMAPADEMVRGAYEPHRFLTQDLINQGLGDYVAIAQEAGIPLKTGADYALALGMVQPQPFQYREDMGGPQIGYDPASGQWVERQDEGVYGNAMRLQRYQEGVPQGDAAARLAYEQALNDQDVTGLMGFDITGPEVQLARQNLMGKSYLEANRMLGAAGDETYNQALQRMMESAQGEIEGAVDRIADQETKAREDLRFEAWMEDQANQAYDRAYGSPSEQRSVARSEASAAADVAEDQAEQNARLEWADVTGTGTIPDAFDSPIVAASWLKQPAQVSEENAFSGRGDTVAEIINELLREIREGSMSGEDVQRHLIDRGFSASSGSLDEGLIFDIIMREVPQSYSIMNQTRPLPGWPGS